MMMPIGMMLRVKKTVKRKKLKKSEGNEAYIEFFLSNAKSFVTSFFFFVKRVGFVWKIFFKKKSFEKSWKGSFV